MQHVRWPVTLAAIGLAAVCAPSAGAATPTASAPAEAEATTLLVVDHSAAMREADGSGNTRSSSVALALRSVLRSLPSDAPVGLRVYGQQVATGDREDTCADTTLLAAPGPARGGLLSAVEQTRSLGAAALGAALGAAVDDLPSDEPSTVIVVATAPDDCAPDSGPDPCAAAKALVEKRPQARLEAVAFQAGERARSQLSCSAKAGAGRSTAVADGSGIADAVAQAWARGATGFEPNGEQVAGAAEQLEAPLLDAGRFQIAIGDDPVWFAVNANSGQSISARLTLAGSAAGGSATLQWRTRTGERVSAVALDVPDDAPASTASVATGLVSGARADSGAVMNPGTYYLAVSGRGLPAKTQSTLSLVVDGAGRPTESASGPVSTSPIPSTSSGTAASEPLPEPPGASPVALMAGAALMVGIVGAAGYLSWRRRRAVEEPDDDGYTG